MKCIQSDFRRAITGRWFLVALFASVAALYMSIGSQSAGLIAQIKHLDGLEEDFWWSVAEMLTAAMQGEFGVMTLPALSALPFAAEALMELKCGAIRPVIFRTGRKSWIVGKAAGCLFSGILLQGVAVLGMIMLLHLLMLLFAGTLFPWGNFARVWPMLVRRMLCGGIWASVGCLVALLTETVAAAYLAPLCLCYAMMMIGTRFFPEVTMLNPGNWVTATVWENWWLLVLLLIGLAVALLWVLGKKVDAHV